MTLLKVELQMDEVIDVLILIANRYHVSCGGHEMVVARGRSQPIARDFTVMIVEHGMAGTIPIGAIPSAIHPATSTLSAVLCRV